MHAIRNVCIFGGTHGDEMSGIYLLQKWKDNPAIVKGSSFATKTLLANPQAVELARRYRDCDLNRMFTEENLESEITEGAPYEVRRAKEIKSLLNAGNEACDVIIDLHNTTSNIKLCLIHSTVGDFVMHMMNYVSSKLPQGVCNNICISGAKQSTCDLTSCGIGIEVGPQPQRVLRADIMDLQEKAAVHCLDFLDLFNAGSVFDETVVPYHVVKEYVKFPRDAESHICGVIHSRLQDNDWTPVMAADPVFTLFDGTVVLLRDAIPSEISEDDTFYPCFINEAAYYEKDVAFVLTTRCQKAVAKLQKS